MIPGVLLARGQAYEAYKKTAKRELGQATRSNFSREQRMTKANSSKPRSRGKDLPFYRHSRGYWAKKVLKKVHYFGKIADDPDAKEALKTWLATKDILLAGEDPADYQEGDITVADVCNHFLTSKEKLVEVGQLTQGSWDEYFAASKRLSEVFGKHRTVKRLLPKHFDELHADIRKAYGLHKTATMIQRVRSIFKWAEENGYTEKRVLFGSNFKKPPKREFRIHKAKKNRFIEAVEIRKLIDAANPPIKTMILLAINCGFGNDDCCQLPITALDLAGGWLTWYRPKTGMERRAKLWPETIAAIRETLADRKSPSSRDSSEIVFVTKYRNPWTSNAVKNEFERVRDANKQDRDGFTFYSLRHTFKTVAEESGDESATEFIMGHIDQDAMSANYRARFSDERLVKISEHVRKWLFPKPDKAKGKRGAK